VTGYYDGPTEGLMDFGEHIGVYCFKAVAFDFDRERRVLRLGRVGSEQFEAVVTALCAAIGSPKWPFWVPIWNFADGDTRLRIEADLDALCATSATSIFALTDEALEKCFATRTIDEQSASRVNDWMSIFA